MLAAALILAPFCLLDLVLPGGRFMALVGAAWSLAVLLGALLQRAPTPLLRGAGVGLASIGSVVAAAVMAWASGGPASLFFSLLMALPLLVLSLGPDLPAALAATGVAASVAGASIQRAWDRPDVEVAYWLLLSAGVVSLGMVGSVAQRRQQLALTAERARFAAMEAAAAEERRRAELERYAEVGRLAAELSHELNNPLASVAANLRWLSGPDADDPAERRGALEDSQQAVRRLAEVVQRIRRVAHASDEDLAEAATGAEVERVP